MSNEVTTVKNAKMDVYSLISKQEPAFKSALGTPRMAEHFTRIALTMVRANPKLGQCDAMTLLAALMQSAQLKLYPGIGLGQSYVIPYWNSKTNSYDAQFQIGYQGYIDLFYRHQLAKELYVETVYSNDKFVLKLGTDRFIDHEPKTDGNRGEIIGYYAIAKLTSGASNLCYMSIEDCNNWKLRYAKPDKQGKRGVWDTDFDAMAKKTCIKQVLKYMPKSVEMMNILDADESIKRPVSESELGNIDLLPNRMPEIIQEDSGAEFSEIDSEPKSKPSVSKIDALVEKIRDSGITEQDKDALLATLMADKTVAGISKVESELKIKEAMLHD